MNVQKVGSGLDPVQMHLRNFIEALSRFETLEGSTDRTWKLPLRVGKKWDLLGVTEYQGTYYLSSELLKDFSFSPSEKCVSGLNDPSQITLLKAVTQALIDTELAVRIDSVKFQRALERNFCHNFRYGVIARAEVRELIPQYCRFDQELSQSEIAGAISVLEMKDSGVVDRMTAARYFEYCRVAYLANPETFTQFDGRGLDTSDTGRGLYKTWADGRCGGLDEIDLDSEEAFAEWYRGGARQGGHPWEIYRGGNSTHIDLGVYREEHSGRWKVFLSAFSSTRLVETVRIGLALKAVRLPFEWQHADSYTLRLKGQDFIGIVPKWGDIKYGWHEFTKDQLVSDCIRYEWFRSEYTGKPLRPWAEIKKLVQWRPLPVVRLVGSDAAEHASD